MATKPETSATRYTEAAAGDSHPGAKGPEVRDVEVQESRNRLDNVEHCLGLNGRWPLWKLSLVALPQLGVQVLWCFLGPNSAPYMQHLGMDDSWATMNNIAGPITGFFTGPLVGAMSDSSTSKWGRRRPVILAGLVSTWVAGLLFSSSEHFFPAGDKKAIWFAAPMYWVMDVTINILQTPHRALVADLASDDQQVPMQVIFVFFMSVGNFLGYTITSIYPVATDHMLELLIICLGLNTVLIAIQFMVAHEKPKEKASASAGGLCAPVTDVAKAVVDSPRLLYHLAAVQCLVWVGLTSWNLYSLWWFGFSVYQGDNHRGATEEEKAAYAEGQAMWAHGGQLKAVVQLIASLVCFQILVQKCLPPRLVYAPSIFIGAAVSIAAAFFVQQNGNFALVCMALSVMPEAGSFAIPFGLVAALNAAAEKEGKVVSTALQMALLNCCITVGQQVCTMALAAMTGKMDLVQALPLSFCVAAACLGLGGVGALFLNDSVGDDEDGDDEDDDASD